MTQNMLISGDAMTPEDTDLIAQTVHVRTGEAPSGEGWRVMSGGPAGNLWARVAYRYEITREAVKGRAAGLPYT